MSSLEEFERLLREEVADEAILEDHPELVNRLVTMYREALLEQDRMLKSMCSDCYQEWFDHDPRD